MSAARKRSTAAEMETWRENLYAIVEELRPATVRGLIEKPDTAYKRVAQTLADMRDATRWQRPSRAGAVKGDGKGDSVTAEKLASRTESEILRAEVNGKGNAVNAEKLARLPRPVWHRDTGAKKCTGWA